MSKKEGCKKGEFLDKNTGKCVEPTYRKGWVHVNIPFTKSQSMGRIFSLERKLPKNVSFDSGSDFKSRDWELDWSLKGARPKTLLKILREHKIKFKTRKTADQWGKRNLVCIS